MFFEGEERWRRDLGCSIEDVAFYPGGAVDIFAYVQSSASAVNDVVVRKLNWAGVVTGAWTLPGNVLLKEESYVDCHASLGVQLLPINESRVAIVNYRFGMWVLRIGEERPVRYCNLSGVVTPPAGSRLLIEVTPLTGPIDAVIVRAGYNVETEGSVTYGYEYSLVDCNGTVRWHTRDPIAEIPRDHAAEERHQKVIRKMRSDQGLVRGGRSGFVLRLQSARQDVGFGVDQDESGFLVVTELWRRATKE